MCLYKYQVRESGVFGTYIIRYNATDSSGNAADEVIRTVIIADDATPPVLNLNENITQTIECVIDTYNNYDIGSSAYDIGQENVTISITPEIYYDNVSLSIVGTYSVKYTAMIVVKMLLLNTELLLLLITLNQKLQFLKKTHTQLTLLMVYILI